MMDVSASTGPGPGETSGMRPALVALAVLAVCAVPLCARAEFKPPPGETWWARFEYQPYLIHSTEPVEKTLAIASTGEVELVFHYTIVP